MNKAELIKATALKSQQPQSTVGYILDTLVSTISESLSRGDDVSLAGFGRFTPVKRNARTARNPKTGVPINVAARTTVVFKPATLLKTTVNNADLQTA